MSHARPSAVPEAAAAATILRAYLADSEIEHEEPRERRRSR